MSDSDSVPPAAESPEKPAVVPAVVPDRGARTRRRVLLVLLVCMLGALWYDRKVARIGVETAYDRVERLNEETNATVGKSPLTNKDVQQALQATPSQIFQEGGYQIEKYSWRAGLPIITRDYYAVFSSSPPNRFLKHYKFELPKEELTGNSAFFSPSTTPAETEFSPAPVSTDGT